MASKTWFISGASSGFGREWSRAALARGDRVAGTSRETVTRTLSKFKKEKLIRIHGSALHILAPERLAELSA